MRIDDTLECSFVLVLGTAAGEIAAISTRDHFSQYADIVGGEVTMERTADMPTELVLLVAKDGLTRGLEPNHNLFPYFYAGNVIVAAQETAVTGMVRGLSERNVAAFKEWMNGLRL